MYFCSFPLLRIGFSKVSEVHYCSFMLEYMQTFLLILGDLAHVLDLVYISK